MKTQDAINYYKTESALARAFTPELTRGAVNQWPKDGLMPIGRALYLEKITGGKLSVDLADYGIPTEAQTAA
ncbi:hypothetical protein PS1M3_19210 [Pseudoalteromonas sp. PS1M3]|jgi:hypothetical protein|uniref:Cro/CI family transcriptional regulator n=1 Tax=unclassified Pseudoalteromonas TaxID=194690 RepID=UPI00110CADDF|nr:MULTISPECIES: Cro/CI family transcriptional regulator [unclassified Pseudoalteromonas]TMS82491.1 hypothetical protein CWB65_04730 [Pseudoalteromonas sp. S554]BBW91834.1 hypothetical protein PS1M3_19210 [Pseudoalteromonas sp. PS1M3]